MRKKRNKKNSKPDQRVWWLSFRGIGLKKEVYFFISNLSMLLSSGLRLSSALESLQEETKSRRMRKILSEIEQKIEGGSSLFDALEETGVFPLRILSLVKVGEESGNLSKNLEVATLQNEKEAMFRSKVRSSLMYGVIVFTLSVVVGAGSAWFTLPKVAVVFEEFEAELPAITRGLIVTGNILSAYGIFIIPFFLLGIVAVFYFLFSFPKTKFLGHAIVFRLPIVKNLVKQVEISRFGFLLGTMLEAGMSVVESFDALHGTTTFKNYQMFYVYLKQSVENGNSIQKSFADYPRIDKLFPSSSRQMISAAEQSGNLSGTLLKIGSIFEQKIEATAKNLPTVLEPLLLLLIGLGVAFLAIGIIMPIYNLTSAI